MENDFEGTVKFYQSIKELGIKGRFNTEEECEKIGMPKDLTGWSVLDIGCNIGAYLLEAVKRKAGLVVGVEPNSAWRWMAKSILSENITPSIQWQVYKDISELSPYKNKYDLVLLLSVLHVCKNPQKLLDTAWKLTKKMLIVEINDYLQEEPLELPEDRQVYGRSKDGRSVYHFFFETPIASLKITADKKDNWLKNYIKRRDSIVDSPHYLYLIGQPQVMAEWMEFRRLPANYHTEKLVRLLVDIAKNGQRNPIKIYKDGRINTGHKRAVCMFYLGYKTIRTVTISNDYKL